MEKLTKENEKAFAIHSVMCCAFADWYDKSQYYGDKGFTTEEVFKLFLEQHCT